MNKQQWTHIAEAVNRAAVARGLTRKQLGMFAGCTGATMGNALNGKFNMSEEKWRMVCERLGLDYDGILAGGNGELVRDTADDTTNVDMEQELRCVIEELRKELEQERVRAVEAEARVIQEVERREAAEEECKKLEGKLDGERARYQRQAGELEELRKRHDAASEKVRVLTVELMNADADVKANEEELAKAQARIAGMERDRMEERELIRTEIWREAEAYVEQHRQETSRALLMLKAKLYDAEHPELVG